VDHCRLALDTSPQAKPAHCLALRDATSQGLAATRRGAFQFLSNAHRFRILFHPTPNTRLRVSRLMAGTHVLAISSAQ